MEVFSHTPPDSPRGLPVAAVAEVQESIRLYLHFIPLIPALGVWGFGGRQYQDRQVALAFGETRDEDGNYGRGHTLQGSRTDQW